MRRARAANPYEYGAIFLRKFLACVPHARPQNFARRLWRVQRSNPSRRVLPLIERNILMILFRNRVPVTRGHRATIDRTVDFLLPGHLGRFLFLRHRLLVLRPVFSVALFSGAMLSGTLASGA